MPHRLLYNYIILDESHDTQTYDYENKTYSTDGDGKMNIV